MRRYSILHPLWMAFYSGDIYDDVARNWRIQPFLYLIILLAMAATLVAATTVALIPRREVVT